MVELDRNGLEVLTRDESLRLLRDGTFGRIAVSVDALPTILPVNYRLIGDTIMFRTGVGEKLYAAARNAVVAFEVDEMDPLNHSGWSVVVTGIAREITEPSGVDPDELARLARWLPTPDGHVVAIDTSLVTGRRLRHGVASDAPR